MDCDSGHVSKPIDIPEVIEELFSSATEVMNGRKKVAGKYLSFHVAAFAGEHDDVEGEYTRSTIVAYGPDALRLAFVMRDAYRSVATEVATRLGIAPTNDAIDKVLDELFEKEHLDPNEIGEPI